MLPICALILANDTISLHLQDLYIRDVLHPPPMDEHTLDNYKIAFANAMDGQHAKQIFVMPEDSTSKL